MNKNRKFLLTGLLLIPFLTTFSQIKVCNLLTENLINPIGLDTRPRFSWQLTSDQRNVMQTAYELRVSNNISDLSKEKKLIWQSKKTLSDSSVYVRYKGPDLQSGTRYYWQVTGFWLESGCILADSSTFSK